MIVRKYISHEGKLVLAIADNNLLGKKFSEGGRQLDLTTNFYAGSEMDEMALDKYVRGAYILNVVGEESVNLAMKYGLLDEAGIQRVEGIPYAQVLVLDE